MVASDAHYGAISKWIGDSPYAALASACIAVTVIGMAVVLASRARRPAEAIRLRELAGSDGNKLVEIVATTWKQLSGGTPMPTIRWFPAMDVAAYASSRDGRPELQVSAGLWRSAVSGEPIARAILAHELAHLIYRDPLALGVLKTIVTGARGVMIATGVLGAAMVLFVIVSETGHMIARSDTFLVILAGWIRILAAASVVLVMLPLGWFALRRQVAFITSLIEIRADVVGALWTEGLHRFTQVFASNESVVRTAGRDLIGSMLSPSFSHIPERERLTILRTPALIVTPKLRFFTLSLLLAFLLPINFASPYLFHGSANYLAIQGLSAALNAAIVVMPIIGMMGGPIVISHRRLVIIAIVSCIVTALPRINLEPLSYLPISWLGGFGTPPADWSSLPNEIAWTAADLAKKIQFGVLNLGALAAMIVAYGSLFMLIQTAGRSSTAPAALRGAIGGAVAVFASFIAGHDPVRSLQFPGAEWVASAVGSSGLGHGLLLSLPILSAALIDGALLLARFLRPNAN